MRMNMAAEPTTPTIKAAEQSIMMIVFKAFMAGLSISSRSVPDADGSWVTESSMMLRMMKSPKPSTDAKRRDMNFLAVRQVRTNARTKAVAATKASRMPGRLSSIPTATAAIASKPQIARRMSVNLLSWGVESALVIFISFLIAKSVYSCLTVWLRRSGGDDKTQLHYRATAENAPHTLSGAAAVACSRCWAALDYNCSSSIPLLAPGL